MAWMDYLAWRLLESRHRATLGDEGGDSKTDLRTEHAGQTLVECSSRRHGHSAWRPGLAFEPGHQHSPGNVVQNDAGVMNHNAFALPLPTLRWACGSLLVKLRQSPASSR